MIDQNLSERERAPATPGQIRPAKAEGVGQRLVRFMHHVVKRFIEDGCFAAAGALSYTTLVSIVPLLAISLAVLSAFPIFDKLRERALMLMFDNFVPTVGATVEGYISSFAQSAGKTTAIGLLVLAVTAIMLLATIEDRLDAIWRVHAPRRWLVRVLTYWTVLTLGPLLFGVGLSLSTSLNGLTRDIAVVGASQHLIEAALEVLAAYAPFLLETVGFTLLFCLIPHCPVRWRDGAVGAVVAALLFEGCKAGFTLYLGHFNAYTAIYGALAVIPIFLLWMYLSWGVVLFGAEVAAAVPLWGLAAPEEALAQARVDLDLGLAVLAQLADQGRRGGSMPFRVLATQLAAPVGVLSNCLDRLLAAGFIAASVDGGWVLARDLTAARLVDLKRAVETEPDYRRGRRNTRLGRQWQAVTAAEQAALDVPIANLLGEG
ncbi:MAG TPA: YihY family inner membrane protein [Aliidongia sp.]|uniref:YihY family inner membrane protein n=1 Tax=Aliidongia sp. TaxID=1914230 RepID=UPI002DDD1688|nr:YihY family inner membrane protein [Aliidongia sp.]HEV2677292.1 YihY family inner membrane protein [Aliidongia sp.]